MYGNPIKGGRVYGYEAFSGEGLPQVQDVSDYQSSITGSDGFFSLVLSPGRYVFIARKRYLSEQIGAPVIPDDYSSDPTIPIQVKAGEGKLDFTLYSLKGASGFALSSHFNFKWALYGKLVNKEGLPLRGFVVAANRRKKITRKPDYISFPVDMSGNFFLPLNGKPPFFVEIRRKIMGEAIPFLSGEEQIEFTFNAENSYRAVRLTVDVE